MFCTVQVTAAAPMHLANWRLLITGEPAPTKALYGYDVGALKVTFTVCLSTDSTDSISAKAPARNAAGVYVDAVTPRKHYVVGRHYAAIPTISNPLSASR